VFFQLCLLDLVGEFFQVFLKYPFDLVGAILHLLFLLYFCRPFPGSAAAVLFGH